MSDLVLRARVETEVAKARADIQAVQGELAKLTKEATGASTAGRELGTSLIIPPPAVISTLAPALTTIRAELGQSLQGTTALAAAQSYLGNATEALATDMVKLAGIQTTVTTETQDEIAAMAELAAEVDQLRQRVAPAITAEEMLAVAQGKVDAALAAGLITQQEAIAISDQARAKFTVMAGSLDGVTYSANRNTAMVGNLTAQWNDVIMMMIAGQNPMQLAIQQGSQISQVVGPMGAAGALRMLGVGFMSMLNPINLAIMASIALGAATYQWITSAGEGVAKADQLTAQINDLAAAITALDQAEQAVEEPMDRLSLKYGDLAGAVREARLQLADKAFEKAKADLDQLINATNIPKVLPLADVLGLNDTLLKIDALRKKMAEAAQKSAQGDGVFYDDTADSAALTALVNKAQGVATYIGALRDQFKLTQDQATGLAEAISRLGDAESAKDQVAAAQALKSKLVEVFGSIKAADDATGGMVTALSTAIEKGADLASIAGQIGRKFEVSAGLTDALRLMIVQARAEAERLGKVDVAAGLSAALGPAAALAAKLWDAATAAANIAAGAEVRRIPGGVDAIASGDMQWSGGHAHRPVIVKPSGSSGSSGGGGSNRDTVSTLSEDARKAMADLDIAVAAINEKVKAGLLSTAEGAKAISDARTKANDDLTLIIAKIEKMGPAGEAAAKELRTHLLGATDAMAKSMADLSASMADNFKSSFVDAVMGSQDAFSGFINFMERKLLELSYDKFLSGPIGSLFDGLMSGFGSVLGLTPATPVAAHALGGAPDAPLSAWSNQVLDKPTLFPMRGGIGLMAEAGREAIMPVGDGGVLAMIGGREARLPLTRGPGGRLGVALPEWQSAAERAPQAFAQGGLIQGGVAKLVGTSLDAPSGAGDKGPAISVTVLPPPGHTGRVQQRMDGGRLNIAVVVEAVENQLAANVMSGRGALNGAMSDAYGLQRATR